MLIDLKNPLKWLAENKNNDHKPLPRIKQNSRKKGRGVVLVSS